MTTITKSLPGKIKPQLKLEREERENATSPSATQKEVASAFEELAFPFGLTEKTTTALNGVGSLMAVEQTGENLDALREIKLLWEEQFQPEGLKAWFHHPLPLFKGKTPLEKFQEGKGEQVVAALMRLREGMHV